MHDPDKSDKDQEQEEKPDSLMDYERGIQEIVERIMNQEDECSPCSDGPS